ncbi:MAG TPA: MMPL family transporter, partial [Gaiellaceae bacterium]|nr:MMPL family transporter [Gaiellaceae bacterium]
ALVAAGIPLLLALSAVMATMGLLAFPSQLWPVDENISALVLLIGLAVGVDYTMFYLKREREERAAGKSESAALEAAAATSGRSVLISGFTVMTAMAGMFLTGDKTFGSFAMATIMVVAIAVLGSLTVLPALLSWLGDRVNKAKVPFLHRLQRPEGGRAWGWILDRVLRRPLLSAALATGVLIALALPALGMKTVVPGAEALPQDLPAVQTYNKLQAAFPGEQDPATVVVKADSVSTPQVRGAIADLREQALASGRFHEPVTITTNKAGTVTQVELPMDGTGTDEASNAALATLRSDILPATVGSLDGVESGVTGTTAISKDFDSAMRSTAPFVFAFVLAFAFILMLISFRSIVIAVKAIILNPLSVAAAYGVLVLVFQHSWAKGLLGFDYTGGVMAFLPVFLFVILFGLSMDYHVFILSRIREAYDRGMKTEDAVAHGIKTTAGVVTSAAIVMVFVFSIFGTLSVVMLKQFGVGLATAVLIDATIVRAVLLPAVMKLLGDWNWYLPRWLEWLPKLEHDAPVADAPAPVVGAPAPPRRAAEAPETKPATSRRPGSGRGAALVSGVAELGGRELALDLVDQVEVQLEQPPQEADHEQQVLAPVRQQHGGRLGVVEPGLQVGDVLAQSGEARTRHVLPDEIGEQQPQQRLALQGRERDGRAGVGAECVEAPIGERVDRPFACLAGLAPRFEVAEPGQPLRLDVVLALARPVEHAPAARHPKQVVRARAPAPDEREDLEREQGQLAP